MKSLVIFSGGQDSTTCLYYARQNSETVVALSFNYDQRHSRELESAKKIAQLAGVDHHILTLPKFSGSSPLTNPSVEVGHYDSVSEMPGGIEPTFVPGRNMVFLAHAAGVACALGCDSIVIGVSQEDFGGYPDCRIEFITAMQAAISAAVGKTITIDAPLIDKTKKETVILATSLHGCMEALAYSHTCYDGEYPPNPKNHASILRARGFHEAGVSDPLIVRAITEGLLPPDYPPTGYVVS